MNFDNAVEFLTLSGRSLPHAVMMMIPEPWEKHETMSQAKRDFYEYHACLMEPWDGPASIAFADGDVIGAVLDRNGLRPSRYYVTDDDMVEDEEIQEKKTTGNEYIVNVYSQMNTDTSLLIYFSEN